MTQPLRAVRSDRNVPIMAQSFFDQMGGEPVLRAVINDFIDRVFDDVMIGFFFRNASRERIKEMEYQLAAEMLGAPLTYSGRPLDRAHQRHRIMGGQFARRTTILEETLRDHGVADAIAQALLDHNERLRPLITSNDAGECTP